MSIDSNYRLDHAGTGAAPHDPAMIELAQKFPTLIEADKPASLEGRVDQRPVKGTRKVSNSNFTASVFIFI